MAWWWTKAIYSKSKTQERFYQLRQEWGWIKGNGPQVQRGELAKFLGLTSEHYRMSVNRKGQAYMVTILKLRIRPELSRFTEDSDHLSRILNLHRGVSTTPTGTHWPYFLLDCCCRAGDGIHWQQKMDPQNDNIWPKSYQSHLFRWGEVSLIALHG